VDVEREHLTNAERFGIQTGDDFRTQVVDGVLVAESSGTIYPIAKGLPILLPYETAIHHQFAQEASGELARFRPRYRFPSASPAPGETDVLKSFSTEWGAYRYDGVIWDVSYDDNRRRLLKEVGPLNGASQKFLEVGCGVGITTSQAQSCFGGDAVGVDLSLAVLNAQRRFSTNPFLHFVQASAFHLPFSPNSFDIVYSRGVLHHTYSTRRAFLSVSRFCRTGGRAYIWVYGTQSINASPLRRLAYAAEACLRPVLSRCPAGIATVMLVPISFGYLAFNQVRRFSDTSVQHYNFQRALHAARDRFTPRYAHRADAAEVMRWFREAGYEEIQLVDWSDIPSADADDYRRNVGVRGTRSSEKPAGDPPHRPSNGH
jgi:ubiquinone/menaquinone biosynthesis C-methylase UbiE